MRTIRLERVDKEMPLPDRNPITLFAVAEANMVFGDIRYLKTGLNFYFPEDVQRNFSSLIPGMVILDHIQPLESCLQLIVLCCGMEVRIGRMQKIAAIHLFELQPMAVRFAEFVAGKRTICGGAEPIRQNANP